MLKINDVKCEPQYPKNTNSIGSLGPFCYLSLPWFSKTTTKNILHIVHCRHPDLTDRVRPVHGGSCSSEPGRRKHAEHSGRKQLAHGDRSNHYRTCRLYFLWPDCPQLSECNASADLRDSQDMGRVASSGLGRGESRRRTVQLRPAECLYRYEPEPEYADCLYLRSDASMGIHKPSGNGSVRTWSMCPANSLRMGSIRYCRRYKCCRTHKVLGALERA